MGLKPIGQVSLEAEIRTQAHTEERLDWVETQGEDTHLQAKERGLRRIHPADTLSLQNG